MQQRLCDRHGYGPLSADVTIRDSAPRILREALRDLSRRPEPDVTGAIQHAIAGLEATARDVSGRPRPNLGKLVPVLKLPPPLDAVVKQLWGYASNRARHAKEGEVVDSAEAELIVAVAAATAKFLVLKHENRVSGASP